MKASRIIGMTALILLLGACGSDAGGDLNAAAGNGAVPLTQIAAPDNGDWTQIVSETPEGGYRMGNPDAPVKLVEYASITCHVCAEFSEDGAEALQNQYVRSGQVSWEYRPFMLFPTDPAIFMLLRCQGPTPFFRLAEQLYATQEEWTARVQSIPPAQAQALQGLGPTAQAAQMVQAAELDQFFRQRGMPQSRIDSCLADAQGFERLAEITRMGNEQHDVQGTPTFLLNGEKLDVSAWGALEPRLREAIGG